MSQIQCQLKGFNPSDTTRKRIDNITQSILLLLPSSHHTKLTISRYSTGYEGSLWTLSEEGEFLAQGKNTDPVNLVKALKTIIKSQLYRSKGQKQEFRKAG